MNNLSTSILLIKSTQPLLSNYIDLEFFQKTEVVPSIFYQEYRKGTYEKVEESEEEEDGYTTGYRCMNLLDYPNQKKEDTELSLYLEDIDKNKFITHFWFGLKDTFKRVYTINKSVNNKSLLAVDSKVIYESKYY